MKNLFFIFCLLLPFFCNAQCENIDFTYSESGDTIFLYGQNLDSIPGEFYWFTEDDYAYGENQKFVVPSGEVTVTMFYFINPDTCIVSKTFYHEGTPKANCGLKPFSYTIQDFTASFEYNNSMKGLESRDVSWTFGDGRKAAGFSPNHIYAAAGNYEVTMSYTGIDTCSVNQMITIDAEQPDSSDRYIRGSVYSTSDNYSVLGTEISLYKFGYGNGTIDFYRKITLTDTNTFIFNSVPTGYYLVQYTPSPTSELFHMVEPVYYYLSSTWQEALIFKLINSTSLGLWFYINENAEIPDSSWFTGSDTISGSILEANPRQRTLATEGFEHALVSLYNEEGQKLAAMFTNADGSYEFVGLPAGTYTLKISYPGNGREEEIVVDVDGDGNTKETIPDFFLTKGSIITSVKDQENSTFNIYPNPANDVIHLKGMAGEVILELMDLKGKMVNQLVGDADTKFSVANLKAGIYTIRIIQNDKVIVKKMIKK